MQGRAVARGAASQPRGVPGAASAGSSLRLQEALNRPGPLPGGSRLGSSISVPDHRVRPRKLPGQEDGVHLGLSQHHGVRLRQHPLPEGGVWSVSTRLPGRGRRPGWAGGARGAWPRGGAAGRALLSGGKPGLGSPTCWGWHRGPEDGGSAGGITQNGSRCLRAAGSGARWCPAGLWRRAVPHEWRLGSACPHPACVTP